MKPKRTLIIGDIHGNYEALKKALEISKFDITNDRIICIGDYVDGWPNSFEVVNTLLEIKNNSRYENIFLMGNHDKWFLDILSDDFENLRNENYLKTEHESWYIQGGKQTLDSYLKYDDLLINNHYEYFFKELKYYHLEDNKLFVHAGFDPKLGFKFTLKSKPRELIWNRSLFREALNKYLINENLRKMNREIKEYQFDDFDKIFIGHTPTILQGYDQPLIMGNLINVDQGCKKNGRLTIWVEETNEFYQTNSKENGFKNHSAIYE